jgi:hypothetical protein
MIVLKATLAQKQKLEGFYKNEAQLQFIQDGNKNWVVNISVLNDNNFEAIHPQLNELTQIEYVEPII